MQMTVIQANQKMEKAARESDSTAIKAGFESMMKMMMENQKTMLDNQKAFEMTIESKINNAVATEFQSSSTKWMTNQHSIIETKMDEAKEQMKEYAKSFLEELIEAEMGKAKEGHEC
jgi:hypothetical protein